MKLMVHEGRKTRIPTPDELLKAASEVLLGRMREIGDLVNCSERAKEYFRLRLALEEREVFIVMFLDSGMRVIAAEPMFAGTICQTEVHPREVVKRALILNAAQVLVAHNHPSGRLEVSRADIALTGKLGDALRLMDIRLVDHIIVAGNETVSMAAQGLL